MVLSVRRGESCGGTQHALRGYLRNHNVTVVRYHSDAIVPLDHQLLTVEEVAELLRLPVSTIYELARTGRLPHLKIGRALRFSRSDLEAHLAERCRAQIAARAGGG